MSDVVQFYHNPMSRARMVHWMLEEVEAPYKFIPVSFDKKEQKDPQYLEVNPMGKLPAIIHRDVVVTETAAIFCYLADVFAEKQLAPALSDPQRGTYYRWLFFAAGCVEPAVVDKVLERPAPSRPASVGWGTYEDTMHTLETALKPGPYILGEKFSAADVYVASQIAFGFRTGGIPKTPIFSAYLERCQARPGYKRFFEQAQAMMPKGN